MHMQSSHKLVYKLSDCIALNSPLNRFYTILDATDENSLPHGVAANRIAKWILPTVDDAIRKKLRPDLMIFEHFESRFVTGLPLSQNTSFLSSNN